MRTRSSTAKRLLSLISGISLMLTCAATTVHAIPPYSAILPQFENEILLPLSQAGNAWKNVAPNALASYYTYRPLLNADALLAGFPAICGDKTSLLAGDAASTADCYIVSARQLVQPMSLNFLNLPTVSGVSGANMFPGLGLIQGDGFTPFDNSGNVTALLANAGNLTKVWGYGSGGNGWRPYYASAAAPGPVLSRGNAPAVFATTPINAFTTNVDGATGAVALGDPAATGIWHFPAPSFKGTGSALPAPTFGGQRQVLVLWLNELPNVKPVGLDPTVDCGDNAKYCYPYNRIVTHVHGAHVGPESDGLAVSWYTPDFAFQGEGAFAPAAYANKVVQNVGLTIPAQYVGRPIYTYPMTQEAGTIWYHDHAVGTTHNNTDMGMAGFFPVTDTIEKALQTPTVGPPAVPAVLPSGDTYELGFALQDRNFDINGQIAMPGIATYNKLDPNCVFDINNNALPGSCTRLDFMWTTAVNNVLDPNTVPVPHLIPYDPLSPIITNIANVDHALNFPPLCQVNRINTFINVAGVDPNTGARIPFVQCAPFPATSATLEYFGNMPVINGVPYAVYDVQPTVYRMRFIGGNDSRTWIMQLVGQNGLGTPASPFTNAIPSMLTCGGGAAPAGCAVYDAANIVPFFQIGSDQGLLGSMVQRPEIDIMDGERIDVLVDFTAYAGQTITMKNLGDDAPYSGRFNFDTIATRQPTSVDIPEMMKFRVAKTPVATASAQAPANLKALKTQTTVGNAGKIRTIALVEITDEYGRTMPTVDARGYIPPGIRTTEVVQQNTIEQWDIVNTTVDGHPMHLHQVAFQTINRQPIALIPGAVGGITAAPSGFMAGYNNVFAAQTPPTNTSTAARQASIFTPSQYVPIGVATPVAAYDSGPKDTIQCPPGYVTRVKAFFDIIGDYVWHCHILSHEEHDMMRPFRVTPTVPLAAPTTVTAGAVTNGVVTVTVSPAPTAPIQAVVQYRIVGTPFWSTNNQITSVQTINLVPTGVGTYEFRAQFMEPAIQNVHANTAPDSIPTAGNTVVYALVAPVAAPTVTAPKGIGNATNSAFTFTGVFGADSYSIYLYDYTIATGSYINFTSAQAGCSVGTACSYTPITPLTNLHDFGWSVAGANAAGMGPRSTVANFRVGVLPVAPTALTPQGAAIPLATAFTFTGNAAATGYVIYLNDYTTATGQIINFTPVQAGCSGATACSYTPAVTPLTTLHRYGWDVATVVSTTGQGPWSSVLAFTAQ